MSGHESAPGTWRTSSLILLAVVAGVLTGFAEAAFLELQRLVFGRIVFMGRHAWWMKPAAEAALFALIVGPLLLIGRRFPAMKSVRTIGSVSGALAVLSLLLMVGRLHIAAQLILAIGIGVQLGRLVERWLSDRERFVRVTAGVLVLTVPLVGMGVPIARAGGSGPGSATGTADGAPNVLLLVLDTVRARSLSAFGHDKPTSPSLERIAAEGVLFERAISTAPWTLPSHGSMFTGFPPHDMTADWRMPLDDTHPTIAEYFSDAGYATAGFVANMGYCGWETGLDRGFEHYEDHPISWRQLVIESSIARIVIPPLEARITGMDENFVRKSAADVNGDFLDWLAGETRPFFAFLNYYDAHGPYQPFEPYRTSFAEGEPRGGISPLARWLRDPFVDPPPDSEIEQELWAYEAAIAGLDAEIGRLVDELETRGLLDNTVVVVVSDHGEEFGEHGAFDHGNSLFLDGVHVPLIIRYPSRLPAGARVTHPITLADLPSTILDLAGSSATGFPGRSLAAEVGHLDPDARVTSEVTLAPQLPDWFPVSRGDMASVTDARWHLVRDGAGAFELFEIDPASGVSTAAPSGAAATTVRDSLASLLGRAVPEAR